jgi:hypothetical protein
MAGLEHLESLGAVMVEIAIPNLHALSMAHGMKISTEFALGQLALPPTQTPNPNPKPNPNPNPNP